MTKPECTNDESGIGGVDAVRAARDVAAERGELERRIAVLTLGYILDDMRRFAALHPLEMTPSLDQLYRRWAAMTLDGESLVANVALCENVSRLAREAAAGHELPHPEQFVVIPLKP